MLFSNWLDKVNERDWQRAKFSVLLASESFVPDQAHDVFVADVLGEIAGGSYSRQPIVDAKRVRDGVATEYTARAVRWPRLSADKAWAVRWAIVFCDLGDDTESELVCALDLTRVSVPAAPGAIDLEVRFGRQDVGAVFSLRAA